MTGEIIHIARAAPTKPAVGAPCNGCGVCCLLETCPLARLRFRQKNGPCPALRWSAADARYFCGVLQAPEQYLPLPGWTLRLVRRLIRRWIAAGAGCDCTAEVVSTAG